MFYSIIIATFNRLPILKKCLKAFEDQKFDPKQIKSFELILIDDASTDGTAEWFKQTYKNQPNFRLIEQKNNQGRSHTRNLGIKNAKGDMLLFVDSDIIVLPDFLEQHFNAFTHAQKKLRQR